MTAPDKPTKAGTLPYRIYGQDGQFVHLECQDTPDMRRFVEWLRRFDRYTPGKRPAPPASEGSD